MTRTALLALTLLPALSFADLVAWFPLNGNAKDVIKGAAGVVKGDSSFGSINGSLAANFGGENGVVYVPDSRQFALGPSFSVSARVWIKALPQHGTSPAGQIVFRGDDRSGLDNFSLNLGNDGYYSFYFNDKENNGVGVRAPAKLNCWQTLLGTFDAETRKISLYLDGYLVGFQYSTWLPVTEMDKNCVPGLSIGNVQNPFGGLHNQPFNGYIRDVKLFNSVASWEDVTKTPRSDSSNE